MTQSLQQYNISPWLTPVRVAAMSNISGSYYNGPSNNGVGALFTCATGSLTIDGVVVIAGDYVLLGAQSLSYENGIYECLVTGATGVAAVLQRRNDMQCIEQMKEGQYVSVSEGTVLAGAILTITGPLPSVIGQPGAANAFNFVIVATAGGASGSGTVSAGTANQIAYYATTGTTVSGLAGGNNTVLVTNNTGVPSMLANGTAGQVLTANSGAPPSWQAGGGGPTPAFLYDNGTEIAVGGTGPLPSSGQNCVFFGTNITASGIFQALAVGTGINVGGNFAVFALGSTMTINNGSAPQYCGAIGGTVDYSNASSSFMVGNNNTVNAPYSLVIGPNTTIPNTGNGINVAIGGDITMPGTANFAFGGSGSMTINNAGSWVIGGNQPVNSDTAANQFNATYSGGYQFFLDNTPTLAVGIDATGQLSISQTGKGLTIKSGSNCKVGTAVLVGGTVTVANTSVTASSLILLTVQLTGGVQGNLSIGTVTAGTSFIINSNNVADTSTVGYMIVEKG